MVSTAQALIDAGQGKQVQAAADEDMAELRRRLVKVIKIQSLSKRLTPREMWIIAYERLREATGFNAVARSTAAKDRYHLDAVERHGFLPNLLGIAAEL